MGGVGHGFSKSKSLSEDRDPCTVQEQQVLGKGRQAWGLTRRFLGRMRGLFCPFIL